jgi:hypothetical protein
LVGGYVPRVPGAIVTPSQTNRAKGIRVKGGLGWLEASCFALVVLCFVANVTYGTFRLFDPEPVGVFYDYQAQSLIHGRLDVPLEAIAGEAFIVGGKYYGYFGPTPALLRIPLIAAGVSPGRLARSFMLAYFIAALVASRLILREVSRRLRGADATPSTWAASLLILNVGLGSTLFFLGDRAMMYHEAILCGAMFALWSGYFTLRFLAEPTRRAWIPALVFGVASIHARPSVGLFALCFLGASALFQAVGGGRAGGDQLTGSIARANRQRYLLIAVLCGAGVLSFNGLAYLKFKTLDGAPLRLSQPYTPERLARIDGKSFHVANLPFGFYSYVVHGNFHLERGCPYVRVPARTPGVGFPRAKIDLPDYTVAFPYAMPALFCLATLGAASAAARSRAARPPLLVLWAGALPMTLALFAAVATAHRYTGDFCPLFIVSGVFGLVAIDGSASWGRTIARWATMGLTVVAVFMTVGLTLDYQGNWAPAMAPEIHARYQRFFHAVDDALTR